MSFTVRLFDAPSTPGLGHDFADWEYDEQGALKTITDTKIVDQRIAKMAITPFGSNPFDDEYGSKFQDIIGEKVTSMTSIQGASFEARRMVNYMIGSQREVESRQDLTPQEKVLRYEGIRARPGRGSQSVIGVLLTLEG